MHITIVSLGPDVIPGLRVDELRRDPDAAAAAAHAAFDHVAHAEFARHLLDVHGAAFVSEAGIARDHEQRAAARKLRDDVVGDAVREVFLVRITAHVGEGQHSDRGLVRQRQWSVASPGEDRSTEFGVPVSAIGLAAQTPQPAGQCSSD